MDAGPAPLVGTGLGGGPGMDLFSLAAPATSYSAPPTIILKAAQAKGLEVGATFSRRNKTIYMDMSFTNRSMVVS